MRCYRWQLRGFSACQKDAPSLNFDMHSILSGQQAESVASSCQSVSHQLTREKMAYMDRAGIPGANMTAMLQVCIGLPFGLRHARPDVR